MNVTYSDLAGVEASYAQALSPLQFAARHLDRLPVSTAAGAGGGDGVEEVGDLNHHYGKQVKSHSSATATKRLPRLMKELRSLRRSLPMNFGSSVFLRYDKRQAYVMQVLITGPGDTPYDSGCFLFDLYCPPAYPDSPPLINLCTTGGGSVRFNPNLYNCGKVCLSLLGTWSGETSEMWTKDSSLLQLFVSIQSLIFVPEPVFNEPGEESLMGSAQGKALSRTSSNGGWEDLRVQTIKFAMVDMLRSPPAGFEDVVREHFRHKQEYILAVADQWLAQAEDTTEALAEEIDALKRELRTAFGDDVCQAAMPSVVPPTAAASLAEAEPESKPKPEHAAGNAKAEDAKAEEVATEEATTITSSTSTTPVISEPSGASDIAAPTGSSVLGDPTAAGASVADEMSSCFSIKLDSLVAALALEVTKGSTHGVGAPGGGCFPWAHSSLPPTPPKLCRASSA